MTESNAPQEVAPAVVAASATNTVPTLTGYLYCGLEQVQATITAPSARVALPFATELKQIPAAAAFGVALLTGFKLAYENSDHELLIELVQINPLPTDRRQNVVTGQMQLCDSGQDKPWTGTVYITVLYFAPYWS